MASSEKDPSTRAVHIRQNVYTFAYIPGLHGGRKKEEAIVALLTNGQAIGRLHHLSSAAVSTLGKVMLEGGNATIHQSTSRG